MTSKIKKLKGVIDVFIFFKDSGSEKRSILIGIVVSYSYVNDKGNQDICIS